LKVPVIELEERAGERVGGCGHAARGEEKARREERLRPRLLDAP